jgi:uncharacterized membrane protein YfcA
MLDATFLIFAGGAVLVGAAVQTSVGLGLGLVAAPVVSMLDPTLMPGSVLITTALLPVLTLSAEWRHTDLRGMSWALGGRLVGTGAGVWVVATLAPRRPRSAGRRSPWCTSTIPGLGSAQHLARTSWLVSWSH